MLKHRYGFICGLEDEPVVASERDRELSLSVFGELMASAGRVPQGLKRRGRKKIHQPHTDPASNLIAEKSATSLVRSEFLLQLSCREDDLQRRANQI